MEPQSVENSQGAQARLLVVDDERSMRELLSIVLRREGHDVTLAESGRVAIDWLERARFDLLISDIKMPDMSGVDVLRAAKKIDHDILSIMITAFASADTAIEAMRLGAHDYLSKPFDVDELKMKVRNALEQRQLRQENVLLKRALGTTHQFANIVGRSEKMLTVFKLIEQIARTDSTVLVTGESGTGKEWVARAIHFYSLRRDRPFVAINCGALPEPLLESELFGHVQGLLHRGDSRQGRAVHRRGRGHALPRRDRGHHSADPGEAPARASGAHSGGRHRRRRRRRPDRGGDEQGPRREVESGNFREDLFYRLNVIPIIIPPLRDRTRTFRCCSAEYFLGKSASRWERTFAVSRRSRWSCSKLRLARQHPRARERDRTRRRAPGEDSGDSARQPA